MKPILFNTEMVKAILDGRKSVTRRAIKPPALDRMILDAVDDCIGSFDPKKGDIYPTVDDCRYQPSDILYARETWAIIGTDGTHHKYGYRADKEYGTLWRPSIHMPKEAARLFLRVTNVRVERLQDITEEQAIAEGVYKIPDNYIDHGYFTFTAVPMHGYCWSEVKDCFHYGIWDSTIKKADLPRYGWDANPFVWVIEFEKTSKEEALAIETSR